MIEVEVHQLGIESSSQAYVVILREKGGERILPIWIGQPEAESIAMERNGMKPARPLTHDLCKRLIVGLGATLTRVHITRVKDNTYFAELHLQRGGEVVQIDARPSDSIALALRCGAPLFADDALLSSMPVEEQGENEGDENAMLHNKEADQARAENEALRRYLQELRPEDFGRFNL
jgi:bifunctional DNase/RNase